jgi:hypothetical protein
MGSKLIALDGDTFIIEVGENVGRARNCEGKR